MTVLPPLRLPRSLVEAPGAGWPSADADGLISVVLEHRHGRWVGLQPASRQEAPALMALPPLVDAHAHLDKVYSWPEAANRSGRMDEALAANQAEHQLRQADRVAERAERALQEGWQLGLRAIRSHVDSLGPGAAPAWEVLPDLAERWRDRLTLQLVAMVPITHWGTAAGEALAQAVAARGGLLGGVLGPPFHRGPDDRRGLESLLRLADRYGCGIDLHVDEGEDQPGEGVALICSLLEQLNLRLPITCSHAASMSLLPQARPGEAARAHGPTGSVGGGSATNQPVPAGPPGGLHAAAAAPGADPPASGRRRHRRRCWRQCAGPLVSWR